ncbi:MAG: CPBP family intramembrane metalloprotease [Candidatus Marinimicrobia bacterium]|nr:CPBP family intramembrane metalloprotease [Candidatus Neomarinimicrobiota bacterium]
MNDILPTLKKSVVLIIAGFGVGILLALLYSLGSILYNSSTNLSISQLRISLLIGELMLPFPILLWAYRNKLDMQSIFRLNPVRKELILPVLISGLCLVILIDELDRILAHFVSMPDNFQEIQALMEIDSITSGIIIIGIIVVLGPFIEEIVFRGFFQRVLEQRLSNVTHAVLISAFTFAVLHFNPWWLIQIYILGFVMAFFAYRTGSIVLPLIVHALNNGISVIASQFDGQNLPGYLWHGHVNPLIIILSVYFTYWSIKKLIRLTGSKSHNQHNSDWA